MRSDLSFSIVPATTVLAIAGFATSFHEDVPIAPKAKDAQLAVVQPTIVSDEIVIEFTSTAGRYLHNQGNPGIKNLVEVDDLLDRLHVSSIRAQFPGAPSVGLRPGQPNLANHFVIKFDPTKTPGGLDGALAMALAHPLVRMAESIGIHPLLATTNDPSFSDQWHLNQSNDADVDAPEAWDTQTGDASIIVAILDSGVRWYHGDLGGSGANSSDLNSAGGNIWLNSAESGGASGVDDDGNGYVDDIIGYDFVSSAIYTCWSGEDCSTADNDPRDFNGHGTHCAGIVSALNNNGYSVSSPAGGFGNGSFTTSGDGVRIMCLRMGHSANYGGQEYGFVRMDYAASALYYAAQNGAKIASCSWGSSNSGGIAAAADYFSAAGGLIFVAAGNSSNSSAAYMNSRSDTISVAALGENDSRASFSSYGSWVDVSAPGEDILSTYHYHPDSGNDYNAYLSGTSMATPLAASVTALAWSVNPSASASDVWAAVRDSADDISAANPNYNGLLGSGRVNAQAAVAAMDGGGSDDNPCDSAVSIALGDTSFGTAAGSGNLDLSSLCDPGPTGDDVLYDVNWYLFTAAVDGTHTVSTCSAADFDTRLAVLGSCDPLSIIACNDDGEGCSDYTSELTFEATAGSDYIIAVGGFAPGSVGSGTLSISEPDSGGGTGDSTLLVVFQGNPIFLTTGKAKDEDIIAVDTSTGDLSVWFDGSDVGLASYRIDALARLDDGDLLLSFTNAVSVDGLSFDDSDVVRFTPTSLGVNTAGSFSMYLDGSDVGLTTNGEDTDGLDVLDDGSLLISTSGTMRVTGLTARDEDIALFFPSSLGDSSSGSYAMWFDGSDVGLSSSSSEDVDAISLRPDGSSFALSTRGNFGVTDLSGGDEDLFNFEYSTLGSNTSGSFSMFFDGSDLGVASKVDILAACEF